MQYELHLTTNRTDLPAWENVCNTLQAKPLWIFLEQGDTPRQLMMAKTEEHEDLTKAFQWATNFEKVMGRICPIIRAKVECPLDKVVGTGLEPAVDYYEMHIKLMMEDRARKALELFAKNAGLAVSWNMLSERDGYMKYYVTQRVRTSKGLDASASFGQTFDVVRQEFDIARMEMEAVLLDTKKELDKGWCEP